MLFRSLHSALKVLEAQNEEAAKRLELYADKIERAEIERNIIEAEIENAELITTSEQDIADARAEEERIRKQAAIAGIGNQTTRRLTGIELSKDRVNLDADEADLEADYQEQLDSHSIRVNEAYMDAEDRRKHAAIDAAELMAKADITHTLTHSVSKADD